MYRLHILILMIFPLIIHGQTEDGVKSGIITVNFKIVENAFVDFVLIDSLGNRTDTFHLAYYPGVFKSENGKWPDMSGFEKISIIIKCQGNKGIEQYQGTFDLFIPRSETNKESILIDYKYAHKELHSRLLYFLLLSEKENA